MNKKGLIDTDFMEIVYIIQDNRTCITIESAV